MNYGHVIVAGRMYPNPWVPEGQVIAQVLCDKCKDGGLVKGGQFCDCATGLVRRRKTVSPSE